MRNLEFDASGFEDLAWWVEQDRKKAMRIIKLIMEVQKDPFHGIGKPEPLKHELAGCWSRRVDGEHRLVYQVTENKIRILACKIPLLISARIVNKTYFIVRTTLPWVFRPASALKAVTASDSG